MERGKLTIKEAEIEIEADDLLTYLKDVVDLVDGIIVELKSIIEAKEAEMNKADIEPDIDDSIQASEPSYCGDGFTEEFYEDPDDSDPDSEPDDWEGYRIHEHKPPTTD